MRIYLKSLKITKFKVLVFTSLLVLLLLAVLAIAHGSVKLDYLEVIQTLLSPYTVDDTNAIIIFNIRFPRMVATLFAGAALAVAGLILQTVMSNPLASPSIIGLNSGAGLGAVLMFTFFPYAYEWIPVVSSLFAFLATLLVFMVSYYAGGAKIAIILAGIAISNIISACLDFISIFIPESTVSATSFLIGSFASVTADQIQMPIIYISLCLTLAFLSAPTLNILMLGDETAHSLGVNVKQSRLFLIIIATILAGSAISFCGLIGFIGLLVPHIVRLLIGTDHKQTLILTPLFGAIFMMACDLIVRVIFAPYEVPVGILLAFLGGPFFIYLLIRSRKNSSTFV